MRATDVIKASPGYELKSELARHCLPAANRDSNRKLAWANSVCILFLLIGVFGSKPAEMSIKPLPVIEDVIPAIIEPTPPPPQTAENQKQEETDQEKPDVPRVVVVTPMAPSINFSVPTIGNLVAPANLAKAPPLNPLRPITPVTSQPASLSSTGVGGERPQPPYPKLALESGMQGTVVFTMTVDETGAIAGIAVKESSGYPLLDRGTIDYVRRHWTVPPGAGDRVFEGAIIYKLQLN